jgi:hypothetical protein
MVKRTATESLARVLQTSQQSTSGTPVYDNNAHREQFQPPNGGPTDPALTSLSANYSGLPVHPYSIGSPVPVPRRPSNTYNQQAYIVKDEPMTSNHAVAPAPASNAPQANNNYTYPTAQTQPSDNGQLAYSEHGFAPQDCRQWTRTYMQPQPLGQPGEYLNTATTLMALGGHEGTSQGSGNPLNTPGIRGHHAHWPEISFPGAANGHMG